MRRTGPIHELLSGYHPRDPMEAVDLKRIMALLDAVPDPWSRSLSLHLTASALILHPGSGRVLLRWHQRQSAWLQVGGHGDPGESDPLEIAMREALEETGLPDLIPWPDPGLLHLAVVAVPARGEHDPAHEHADLRFTLATEEPEAARPEKPDAPLRWLSVPEARSVTTDANVRETLARAGSVLGGGLWS